MGGKIWDAKAETKIRYPSILSENMSLEIKM